MPGDAEIQAYLSRGGSRGAGSAPLETALQLASSTPGALSRHAAAFLAHLHDPEPAARAIVLTAITRAAERDPSSLVQTHAAFLAFVKDRHAPIVRLAFEACAAIFRPLLQAAVASVASGSPAAPGLQRAWRTLLDVKAAAIAVLDSPDAPDSARRGALHLLETAALTLSPPLTPASLGQWCQARGIPGAAVAAFRWDDSALAAGNAVTLAAVPPGFPPPLAPESLQREGEEAGARIIASLCDNPATRADRSADAVMIGSYAARALENAPGAASYGDLAARIATLGFCRPQFSQAAVEGLSRFISAPPHHALQRPPQQQAQQQRAPPSLPPELVTALRAAVIRVGASPASLPLQAAISSSLATLGAMGRPPPQAQAQPPPPAAWGQPPQFAAQPLQPPQGYPPAMQAPFMQAGPVPPSGYNQWGQTPQGFSPTPDMYGGPGAPHGYPQVVDLAALEAATAGAEEEDEDSSAGSRWYRMRELLSMPEERALLLDGGPGARVAYALRCLRFLPPRRPLDHGTAAGRPQQQRLGEDALADLFEAAQAALGPDQASSGSSSGGQMRPGHSSLGQWFDIPPAPASAPATAIGGGDRTQVASLSAPVAAAGNSNVGTSSAVDSSSAQSAPLAPAPAHAAAPRLPLASSMPAAQRWLSAGALLPRPAAAPAVSHATLAMLRVVDVALLRLHAQTMSPLDAVAWAELPPPPPEGTDEEGAAQAADDELTAAPSAPAPAPWVPSALVLAMDRTPSAAAAGLLAGTAAAPRQTAAAVALSACSGSGAPWRLALDRLVSLLDGAFTTGPAPPPLSLLLTAIAQSSRAALDAPDASAAPARLVAAVSAPGGGPEGGVTTEARRTPGVVGSDAACLSGPALRQLRSLLLLHAFRLYRAYQASLLLQGQGQQQGGDDVLVDQGGASEELQENEEGAASAGDGAAQPRLAGSKRRRQSSDSGEEPGGGGGDDDMGQRPTTDSEQEAVAGDPAKEAEAPAAGAVSGAPHDGAAGGSADNGADGEEGAEGGGNEEAAGEAEGGGGDDSYSAFVTRALDALLTLAMEATALALRGARDVPAACAAARDVGAADLLGGFLLDLPYLPPQVLGMVATPCRKDDPLAQLCRASPAYMLAYGAASVARDADAAAAAAQQLKPVLTPEGVALACLREVAVFRPALREAAIDALIAVALSDAVVDDAIRMAHLVLSIRVMPLPLPHELLQMQASRPQGDEPLLPAGAAAADAEAAAEAPGDRMVAFARRALSTLFEALTRPPPQVAPPAALQGSAVLPSTTVGAAGGSVAVAVVVQPAAADPADPDAATAEHDDAMTATAAADPDDSEAAPAPAGSPAPPSTTEPSPPAPDAWDWALPHGRAAGVPVCDEVLTSLRNAGASPAPTPAGQPAAQSPLQAGLSRRLIQLWVALCVARPALLHEALGFYATAAKAYALMRGATGSGSVTAPLLTAEVEATCPLLVALRHEVLPLLRRLGRTAAGGHAAALRTLLLPSVVSGKGEDGAAPPVVRVPAAAALFVQTALSELVDDAVEEASEQLQAAVAAAAAASATVSAPPAAAAVNEPRPSAAALLAASPSLTAIVELARLLRVEGSDDTDTDAGAAAAVASEDPPATAAPVVASGAAPMPAPDGTAPAPAAAVSPPSPPPLFLGHPPRTLFLIPVAALLPAPEAAALVDRLLRCAAAPILRSSFSRLVRTPGVAAALGPRDLGVQILSSSDVVLQRPDRKVAAVEATGVLFDDANRLDVFPPAVVLAVLRAIIDAAAARARATPSAPGSVLSALFMRALLQAQAVHAELRGALRGLLISLLIRAGAATFEPLPVLAAFAAGGAAAGGGAVKPDPGSALGVVVKAEAGPPPPHPDVWAAFLMFVKRDMPHALELPAHLPRPLLELLLLGSPAEAVLRGRFRAWFDAWGDRGKASVAHVRDVLARLPPAPAAAAVPAASSSPAARP